MNRMTLDAINLIIQIEENDDDDDDVASGMRVEQFINCRLSPDN